MYARLRCGGNLSLPRPGVDGPLRGNCHPLSCTPDNQVRCVFGSAPYQKQASTVREGYSVPETAFSGTRRIFKGALNSLLLHRMHFRKRKNGLLLHRMHLKRPAEQPTPQTVDSLLLHRTHLQRRAVPKAAPAHRTQLQCAKEPPLSLFAPAAPSLAPSTALGTGNSPPLGGEQI